MQEPVPSKLVARAALALLAFSAWTTLSLVAWLAREDEPWDWHAVIAAACAALGLTTAALVWRAPSRVHVGAGLVVMALSLVRVGVPHEWRWSIPVFVAVTGALMVPVVRALLALPPR